MGDLGDSGDAPFTGDVALESQVYWWHEKYKPRKPKYFNRVHTGYEWNRYNQAHYDSDNPPPKAVQGYKFNIFYPDLIDKVKTPTYHVERDPTSPDGSTCLVRFRAGPPYEVWRVHISRCSRVLCVGNDKKLSHCFSHPGHCVSRGEQGVGVQPQKGVCEHL